MLDLQRQYKKITQEVLAAVEKVCASQHYILGSEVEGLERELADFCGASDAVGCASGTDALWLALVAAGAARRSGSHDVHSAFLPRPARLRGQVRGRFLQTSTR